MTKYFYVVKYFMIASSISFLNCEQIENYSTLCNKLRDNNGLIDFSFTNYRFTQTKWLMNHVVFIGYNIWSVEYTKNGIRVIDRDKEKLPQDYVFYLYYSFKIKVSLIDSIKAQDILYFNGTQILYNYYKNSNSNSTTNFVVDMNPFNDFKPKLAFIPNSFRNKPYMSNSAIFIEQKSENNCFIRRYRIYNISVKHNEKSIKLTEDQSTSIPKFLKQLPQYYYVNAILNANEIACPFCTTDVLLLLKYNGIPKYCVTPEDHLSNNCDIDKLKTYGNCDWMALIKINSTDICDQKTALNKMMIYLISFVILIILFVTLAAVISYFIIKSKRNNKEWTPSKTSDTKESTSFTIKTINSETGKPVESKNK